MKNKLAKITTTAMLVLTTNSLPSYALNDSVAGLPKESKTQINQVTEQNIQPSIDKRTNRKLQPNTTIRPQSTKIQVLPGDDDDPLETYCYHWFWHPTLKKWVPVLVVCDLY